MKNIPLLNKFYSGMITDIGLKTPNDKQANLRHSLDLDSIGNSHSEYIYIAPVVYPKFGSRAESQRKAPDLWATLCRPLSLRLSVRLCLKSIGLLHMIYTFLIANASNRQTITSLRRIRTKSVFANNEIEARNRLAGLPLVFISCLPVAR